MITKERLIKDWKQGLLNDKAKDRLIKMLLHPETIDTTNEKIAKSLEETEKDVEQLKLRQIEKRSD